MDPLRLAIERIVKPIPAAEPRKNIYRKELWAHLHDLYEEQLETGESPEQSLQHALDHLGKPKDLRRQFLASLPIHHRLAVPLISLMVPQDGETPTMFIRRNAIRSWPLIIAAIWSPWIAMFFSAARLETTCSISVAALALNSSLTVCVFMSAVSLLEYRSRTNAPDQPKTLRWFRHYGTLPLLTTLPIALIPATLYGIEHLLFQISGLDTTILMDINLQILIASSTVMILFLATSPLIWMLEARTLRTIPDWPYTKV